MPRLDVDLLPYVHAQEVTTLAFLLISALSRCCLLAASSPVSLHLLLLLYLPLQSRACHPNPQSLNQSLCPLFASRLPYKMHGLRSEPPTFPIFSRSMGLVHGWYVAYLLLQHCIDLISSFPDRMVLPAEHSRTPYSWQYLSST
jgi:hypothetical protein